MASALNLSLLARGVGEVKRNGSEKIDVVLEPSDYHNFTETHLYLPPIHNQQVNSRSAYYESKKLSLPKTFITRKGALLLFSEDFAQKSKYRQHGDNENKHRVTSAFEALDLHTVEDLTKSILSYGGPSGKGEVNLHFVKEGPTQRRVRPGFSARRYLSKLTRSFDETFLSNLMSKGYVSEKSIFQTNILLPNLKKRINDDLSHMPTPYRIMHQMLLAPGILSGYSFYRKTTDRSDSDLTTLDEEGPELQGRDKGELKIVEINDGEIKSVDYSNLPEEQKKNVLADLLVKSAISHALEKQKQMLQSRSQSAQDSDDDRDNDDDDTDHQLMISGRSSFRSDQKDIQEFDMADAVRSYIESQLSSHIDAEITEVIRTQRKPKPTHRKQIEDAQPKGKRRPPRGPSKKAEQGISTTPVLPPISDKSALVEGETRDAAVSARGDVHVPVFTVEPPTPQNTSLSDRQRRAKKAPASKQITEDLEDGEDYEEEVAEVVPKRRRNKRVEHLKASKDVAAITQHNILSPTSSVASKGHHLSPGSMLESGSESTRSDYTTDSPILPPPMPKFRGKALRATGGAPKVRAPEAISKAKGSVVVLPGGNIVKVGGTVHGPVGDVTPQTSRTEEYSTSDYDTERDDWTSKQAQSPKTHHVQQESEFTESEYTTEGASSPEQKKIEAVQEIDKQVKSSKPASEISKKECQESEADMHEIMTAWSYQNAVPSHLTDEDGASNTVELSNFAEDSRRESYQSGSTPPEISEEELVQHLSDQAHRIASAILSRPETGFSLTEDAQRVSQLKSGRMSVAEEYKTLLKDSINSALIKSQGEDAVLVPEDADIDEEVIRAIARNDKLGPNDLEIIENEHGQQTVRIKKSHKTTAKKERQRRKVQSESGSTEETEHYDSSEYSGTPSRSGMSEGKAPSERSRTHPVAEAEQEVVPPESDTSKTEATSDFVSGSRTSESQKREQTRSRSKSGATKEDTKEEFVVRTVHDNSELQRLYGPVDTPPPRTRESKKPRVPPAKPQKKVKKKKAAEKKKIEVKSSESEKDSSPTMKEVQKVKPAKASETTTSQDLSESESVMSEEKEEKEEEIEFVIIRDEFSDSETDETQKAQSVTSSKARSFKSSVLPSLGGQSDTDSAHKHAEPSPTSDTSLHTVSSKAARAAERAARANKKREEVERRRREREELMKREKEMLDERERLQRELEEERRRKEEERRMQREHEEEERLRKEQEEQDRERRRRLEAERERRMREEYARKLEQLKKQKLEDDRKRRELAEQRQREEEERRRQEEELLASMSEAERIEYLKKKAEEEEMRRIELEERKRREAEEMAALEAEARRLAQEMAIKQAELEQRLQFNRSLHLEAHGLEHTLNITEAFTWSYFQLLQWLGLDLPDFERMKNNQF